MHCVERFARGKVHSMLDRRISESRAFPILCSLIVCVSAPHCFAQGPSPAAAAAFNSYVRAVQSRLAAQHQSSSHFLVTVAPAPQSELRLHRGERIVEQITPSAGLALPGALLHHWRGTAFVPGARASAFTPVMQDFSAYPRFFAPQVMKSDVLAHQGNQFQVQMRVRQHHVITVVLDATYDVTFGQLDPLHRYSTSRSTQITAVAGSHSLSEGNGFLWRQNTYWTCEQRDGGLYIQVESISLTPAIPWGLGWAVGPFVQSIPRQSLEFTLRSVAGALQQQERMQK
jgi:hypothetical protein